jgi:molybdopterin synthase catalytic subunit
VSVIDVRITRDPLDVAAMQAELSADPTAGAMTAFVGLVRDHDPEANDVVVALDYSAHPDAEVILGEIVRESIGATGASVFAHHRIGRVAVGEAAVAIVVATAHRDEAFTVCRDVIEAIKHSLPVWKRQLTADGEATWKGVDPL